HRVRAGRWGEAAPAGDARPAERTTRGTALGARRAHEALVAAAEPSAEVAVPAAPGGPAPTLAAPPAPALLPSPAPAPPRALRALTPTRLAHADVARASVD